MKPKLELTWVGKENRPRLEPRVLVEDPAKSYHAAHRVHEGDVFENRLIRGDNLLALKALEQEFAGKVKCVFIDPPYNTGSAFTHYDDGVEHSLWLSLMRDRLVLIHTLLAESGSLWITIDDNEVHYLKVLCDEVFGRHCFVASTIWRSTDNSNNDSKQFSVDHNYVLIYAKQEGWQPNKIYDDSKRSHFKNPDNDPRGAYFDGNPLNSPKPRPNLTFDLTAPNGNIIKPPSNGWRWSKETMDEKIATGEIRFTPDGRNIRRRTYLADMKGLPPSTLWADLEMTGHNRQAKYELKNLFPQVAVSNLFETPKPERLLYQVLNIATEEGDIVLDSFAGSGTTGAVAQKMGRRWIMVELGAHCDTHIVPRLRKVIDGEDKGGVTAATQWKGGGGFRYYTLAPSLLEKDRWGNWVISAEYRDKGKPELLVQALCKLEGFAYAPSDTVYWQQGRSTESDFLYVTTQTLTRDQLQAMSDEVGPERTLLVLCSAFQGDAESWANLTVRKIPRQVLDRCEWAHDDYSLNVENLPQAPPAPPEGVSAARRASADAALTASLSLFDGSADADATDADTTDATDAEGVL